MKTAIKKAAASTAAIQNKQRNKAYPKAIPQSSLKNRIGELLFHLQIPLTEGERQRYWQVFELELRQYLNLKLSGLLNG